MGRLLFQAEPFDTPAAHVTGRQWWCPILENSSSLLYGRWWVGSVNEMLTPLSNLLGDSTDLLDTR